MDICQSGALIVCQDGAERERECNKSNSDDTAVFCCHPAADSGTAQSTSKWAQLSFLT